MIFFFIFANLEQYFRVQKLFLICPLKENKINAVANNTHQNCIEKGIIAKTGSTKVYSLPYGFIAKIVKENEKSFLYGIIAKTAEIFHL